MKDIKKCDVSEMCVFCLSTSRSVKMVAKRTSGDAASPEAHWQQYRAPLELYGQLRKRPVSPLLNVTVLTVLTRPGM